tara:strand:- start:2772 stop:2987 length:216 start_codon:yes stop_codon:yes gene_type:complete
MDLEAIRNTRMCSNAKPPINHTIKYAQEKDIKDHVAEFKANGGKIKKLESVGAKSRQMTYKEVNDSYLIKD